MINHPSLFTDEQLPQSLPKLPEKNFRSLQFPLWTHNKARLIQEYLRLFEFITHHGTYIDGFAAPQNYAHPETWTAKLVLEIEPKWFRDFWFCDINPLGLSRLEQLKVEHQTAQRRIDVLSGDFNKTVDEILGAGRIGEKTATFALLDQRTFECEWQTLVTLSEHKSERKIEQFYFFPTGWIDRSLGAVKVEQTIAKVERWWGKGDWRELRGMDSTARAMMVAKRFEDELRYGKATVYPIHNERLRGRVMYHMIHATDHPDATSLMIRAYRKVSGRSELKPDAQIAFDDFWKRIEADED